MIVGQTFVSCKQLPVFSIKFSNTLLCSDPEIVFIVYDHCGYISGCPAVFFICRSDRAPCFKAFVNKVQTLVTANGIPVMEGHTAKYDPTIRCNCLSCWNRLLLAP